MKSKVERLTVDLTSYPDLVVVYLGMRVNRLFGLKMLLGIGPQIAASAAARPDGLLLHENIYYSFFPMHFGMRQYWRDIDSLLRWTRSDPHRTWWKNFLRDSGGTGFWHESYHMRGGIEAIYDDLAKPVGMLKFAPNSRASGPMFSASSRLGSSDVGGAPVGESELYWSGEGRSRMP
jgi:hypothetical protein